MPSVQTGLCQVSICHHALFWVVFGKSLVMWLLWPWPLAPLLFEEIQTPPFISCWFSWCWPLVVVFERLTEWQAVSCSLLSPVCLTQLVSCKVCWPVFTRLPALKKPQRTKDTCPVRRLPDDLKELNSNHDKLSFGSHQRPSVEQHVTHRLDRWQPSSYIIRM